MEGRIPDGSALRGLGLPAALGAAGLYRDIREGEVAGFGPDACAAHLEKEPAV
jgi:hypothetical protein